MPYVYVPDDAPLECQLLQDIINLTMEAEVPADASLACQLLKEIRDGLAYTAFKIELTPAQIKAAGDFDIIECPELELTQAWEVVCASERVTEQTIAYDGVPTVSILSDGSPRQQFDDSLAQLLMQGSDNWEKMQPYDTVSGPQTNYVAGGKLVLRISDASTIGNGTLTVYGLARRITI